MRAISIQTCGVCADLRTLAVDGARLVCPVVEVEDHASTNDLLKRAHHGEATIVVLGPEVASVDRERAGAALAANGLPRWPVMIFDEGTPSEGFWFVPPARRNASDLAEAIRVALSQHTSRCEAQRARGDLQTIARRFSHEMRSPLGCILTSADAIRDELSAIAPAACELAQPIIDSAREMMELIDRLTLVARASALPRTTAPVDMSMVVWAARERLAVRISKTEAEVSEPAEWPHVAGQAEWLERVWQSLIANALEHAGPRARVELGWTRQEREIRFFVRDRGPGVAPGVVPFLFRPFHQLHLHDSGRGLGLAIVQRLVELQDGRCGYEPAEPSGSCFYFALPAQGATAAG